MPLPIARRTTRPFGFARRGRRRHRWLALGVSLCLAVEAHPDRRAEAEPYWARRVAPVSLDQSAARWVQRQRRHPTVSTLHCTVRAVHLVNWNCYSQKRNGVTKIVIASSERIPVLMWALHELKTLKITLTMTLIQPPFMHRLLVCWAQIDHVMITLQKGLSSDQVISLAMILLLFCFQVIS